MNAKIKKQYNCYCSINHFFKFSTSSKIIAQNYCNENQCYSPELICE